MKIPLLNPKSQGIFYPQNMYYSQETKAGRPAMVGTPGLILHKDFGSPKPIRAMYVMGEYVYAVVGATLYRRESGTTTWTSLGTLSAHIDPCWITGNGVQVMVVDSTEGWIYDTTAGTLSKITDGDFFSAAGLTYQDGYFLVMDQDSADWQCDLGDNTSPYPVAACYAALDYEVANKSPDNNVGIISALGQVWVFGSLSYEIYYNAGGAGFPFTKMPGADGKVGLAAARTLVEIDNSLLWLDDRLMVRRAFSYNVTKVVSSPAMAETFQGFSTTSDAIAFGFNLNGNDFYVLTFPAEKATYVYNCTTSIRAHADLKSDAFWHRWVSYPDAGRHRSNCYAYFEKKHLIGDFENGKIYELGGNHDAGEEIRAVLTFPWIDDGGKKQRHSRFRMNMKNGVGLINAPASPATGTDPQCFMQYSDDGGETWTDENWTDIGKIGERFAVAGWRRLGKTKKHGRIYRTIISDPIEREIYGAELT